MKYTPAVLKEEHVHQLQEIEHHLSAVTGKDLILIAYSEQPELSEKVKRLSNRLRKFPVYRQRKGREQVTVFLLTYGICRNLI